jgi:flagellar motility protein MotE (MotC chaperone)
MRLNAFFAAALVSALASTGALAEEDRYVLEKSDDGFVRMDRQSGEMSTCTDEGAGLVCKLVADERTAYQDEIERLQNALAALDQRVVKLENSLASKFEKTLPTEEEFDKTLSYMERFFRSFMDIVKDMDKDKPVENGTGTPQKT